MLFSLSFLVFPLSGFPITLPSHNYSLSFSHLHLGKEFLFFSTSLWHMEHSLHW